jgi:periplasmic protein TonB
MTENGKDLRTLFRRYTQPRTQPSLFHYIREEQASSVWEGQDWSFLTHPIRSIKEALKTPHTQAFLFHYGEELPKVPFSFKAFIRDLFTGAKGPQFIPSVFANQEELMLEGAQRRTRWWESGMLSVFAHAAVIGIVFLWVVESEKQPPKEENVVYVSNPMVSPFEGDGRDGGGGGGGGKNQPDPPATGRMPDTTRVQMVPPDPENPSPLMPAEDLLSQVASVQMPIDIPQDMSLPIGDILNGPPNHSGSSGSGSGGGIGTGTGTGVGPGKGAGYGPGEGGGMGGGRGGGIGSGVGPYVVGNGVNPPVPLIQTRPNYTEDARKARAEGIVLLQAIVRKDGTVDSFRVLRSLGYGLDEQAIQTIATKWRFKPGTKNGQAVDVIANIEVTFRLY